MSIPSSLVVRLTFHADVDINPVLIFVPTRGAPNGFNLSCCPSAVPRLVLLCPSSPPLPSCGLLYAFYTVVEHRRIGHGSYMVAILEGPISPPILSRVAPRHACCYNLRLHLSLPAGLRQACRSVSLLGMVYRDALTSK